MLKNKNNFETINLFFHCQAKNFSEHPRKLTRLPNYQHYYTEHLSLILLTRRQATQFYAQHEE
jgi:hypothetical protein